MASVPNKSETRRQILVVGATGKQGRALIQALLDPTPTPSTPSPTKNGDNNALVNHETNDKQETLAWEILALTRGPSNPRAQSLLRLLPESSPHTVRLVQGDVNEEASIRSIFERESADKDSSTPGGIWGVFSVLMYPGLRAEDDKVEVKQGKLLADLSHEFNVPAFIYSSALPAGKDVDIIDPSHRNKCEIEAYSQELGNGSSDQGGGLNWIIVRPGFFMENFEGFLGSIAVTVLREGLTPDAAITLIASKDIGRVVAGVFKDHTKFLHKILVLTSGPAIMQDIISSYQRATGKPMPAIPALLGKFLIRINTGCQNLIREIQGNSDARKKGEYYPEFEDQWALARSVCHMQTYEEWKRSEVETEASRTPVEDGWNKVSFWKLITGRS